jgi:hypothetical protein
VVIRTPDRRVRVFVSSTLGERAARLQGAAEGLRRRVGLPAWPHLRKVEAELVTQVREQLGADRFDQARSAGARLTRRQAVATVQDQHRHPDPGAAARDSAGTAPASNPR